MSENEVNKKDTKDKNINTKVFIKERKSGTPTFFMVIITALIAGAIGSVIMYLVLTKEANNTVNNTGNATTSIKIEATDTPVVAIAKKAGPSIVGIKINALSQTIVSCFKSPV